MKQILDLRPVYHRLEDRIRAHVLLCWLALLLIRVVETRTTTPTDLDQLAPRPRRAAAAARRPVHRPGRHFPPDHHAHRRDPPAARRAGPAATAPDPAPRHRPRRNPLTSHNRHAW